MTCFLASWSPEWSICIQGKPPLEQAPSRSYFVRVSYWIPLVATEGTPDCIALLVQLSDAVERVVHSTATRYVREERVTAVWGMEISFPRELDKQKR